MSSGSENGEFLGDERGSPFCYRGLSVCVSATISRAVRDPRSAPRDSANRDPGFPERPFPADAAVPESGPLPPFRVILARHCERGARRHRRARTLPSASREECSAVARVRGPLRLVFRARPSSSRVRQRPHAVRSAKELPRARRRGLRAGPPLDRSVAEVHVDRPSLCGDEPNSWPSLAEEDLAPSPLGHRARPRDGA